MPREAIGKTGVPSETRKKPSRPRDRLGRPLAWDATNELELDDYDAHTLEENDALGREAVHSGRWFQAHEAWETAWKQAKGTGDEELFKGLSQMGAGYVHLRRGNAHGAKTLLRRAARRVGGYPDGHRGYTTVRLRAKLLADAEAVENGSLAVGEHTTLEAPDV